MKAFLPALALAAAALGCPGCMSSPDAARMKAADQGALMKRTLRSYHVAYSDRAGAVGYMRSEDVQEAGGPVYRWSYILDRDFNEVGFVDQNGHAFHFVKYPPDAQPNPTQPYRTIQLPPDSIGRNAARMLGLDPSAQAITFPVAAAGDIR